MKNTSIQDKAAKSTRSLNPHGHTEDRRTDAQKSTHFLAVVGKDRCLSGWGGATGGASRAVWAFDHTKVNSDRVFNWVKARSEMSYVSLVDLRTYRALRGTAHLSIYTVDENHVAAKY